METPHSFLALIQPHPTHAKYGKDAKAGIFNAAYGLEVIAEIFATENKLDNLSAFTSVNGATFYGYEPSQENITLHRSSLDPERATHISTEKWKPDRSIWC